MTIMIEVTTPVQTGVPIEIKARYPNPDTGSYTIDGSGNLTADPIVFTLSSGNISRSYPQWDTSTGCTAKEITV